VEEALRAALIKKQEEEEEQERVRREKEEEERRQKELAVEKPVRRRIRRAVRIICFDCHRLVALAKLNIFRLLISDLVTNC
jgi:hypothetical protein